MQVLSGHSGRLNALAFGPHDHTLLSVASDSTVNIWEIGETEPLATFTCDAPVLSCSYPSDSRIMAGDASGKVHFLSLEPLKPPV